MANATIAGVTVKTRGVQISERITQQGILPPRDATEITIENNSGQNIRWINIEIGYYIHRTSQFKQADGTTTYLHRGWVSERRALQNLEAGSRRTIYSDDDNPNGTIAFIYGEFTGGQTFKCDKGIRFGVEIKQSGCFIATAAYRDHDHPLVIELRGVRDEILVRTAKGRRFIRWYYRNGPHFAAIVAPSPILRAASRAILTPIAQLARLRRRFIARKMP